MKVPSKYIEICIHTIGWCCLLVFPLLFHRHGETLDWVKYLDSLFIPMTMLVMFYLNYCVLVPRYFMKRKFSAFMVFNVIAVILICIGINRYMQWSFPAIHSGHGLKPHHMPHHAHKMIKGDGAMHGGMHPWKPNIQVFFVMRDVFSLLISVIAALAIRLSLEWHKLELLRQRSLTEQADAALKNLKAQISPHFLLNTLNNIYSLIAFNTEKAQDAVLDLAKMLRYQLYETERERVPLSREAEFLDNYIKLMKLRLPETVRVEYTTSILNDTDVLIAPHVLICLVENAFKHGISAKEASYVEISIEADEGTIHFVCRNSHHPKRRDNDKTPGGIGLQQVRQILEMTYAGKYTWTYGPTSDQKSFASELTINNDRQ